jgi:hypothetical protein
MMTTFYKNLLVIITSRDNLWLVFAFKFASFSPHQMTFLMVVLQWPYVQKVQLTAVPITLRITYLSPTYIREHVLSTMNVSQKSYNFVWLANKSFLVETIRNLAMFEETGRVTILFLLYHTNPALYPD